MWRRALQTPTEAATCRCRSTAGKSVLMAKNPIAIVGKGLRARVG